MTTAHDHAEVLAAAVRDLDGYIERRALEMAQPLVADLQAAADRRVVAAECEASQQAAVAAVLRDTVDIRDRQLDQARTDAAGIARLVEGFTTPDDPARVRALLADLGHRVRLAAGNRYRPADTATALTHPQT